MPATVEIVGLNTLVRTLQQAGIDLGELKDANAMAASIAAARISEFAPVMTGRLRGSVRGRARPRGARVMAGSSGVPYAGPINYGWYRRNISPANFMYQGASAAEGEIVPQYAAAIQKVCDSVRGI